MRLIIRDAERKLNRYGIDLSKSASGSSQEANEKNSNDKNDVSQVKPIGDFRTIDALLLSSVGVKYPESVGHYRTA